MDEIRIKKIEMQASDHKRRLDDHDGLHANHTTSIKAMLDWKASIEESTEVNKRMVEVGENILVALSWVGMAAKWIAAVGAACAAIWMGIKSIMHMGAR
jgi:hypothetical protein